jgi:hypothetical protein
MYVTSEITFGGAGVGGPSNGQLLGIYGLMSVTVTVVTLTTVSGAPVLALDVLLGDNQNANLNPNLDTSWAIGAIALGLTVPTGAGLAASVNITGCYRGLRFSNTWGTPGGTFKAQIEARDIS